MTAIATVGIGFAMLFFEAPWAKAVGDISVLTRRLAERKELCRDTPDSWLDSTRQSCERYWGDAERCFNATSFAVDGIDGSQACCGCGGGTCIDEDGWLDADGRDCEHYRSAGWCADEGYGPHWNLEAWGSFCSPVLMGASEACCGCGRARLYGTSMDLVFRQPRCFGPNISLSHRGILASFEGCYVYSSYYPSNYGGGYGYNYGSYSYNYGSNGYDYNYNYYGGYVRRRLSTVPPTHFLDWLAAHGSSVERFDLSHSANAVCEAGVPSPFRHFSNLRSLNLSNCQLHGSFPSFLASLPLEELDLSHNAFGAYEHHNPAKLFEYGHPYEINGSLLPSSWAQLTSLRVLDLSANKPGISPGPDDYSFQYYFGQLYASGSLPQLPSVEYAAASPSLEVLRLSGLALEIPSEWQQLQRLKILDLTSPGLYDLPYPFHSRDTSREGMSSFPLFLPTWVAEVMSELEEIRLAAFLVADVRQLCPTQQGGGFRHLRKVELQTVATVPPSNDPFIVPTCWAYLPSLEELILIDVGYQFSLSDDPYILQPEYANLISLKRLVLRGSDFNGPWPAWIGDLPLLEELDVSKIAEFDIRLVGAGDLSPRFRGPLPERWRHLATTLRILRLDRNRVESTLPPWLQDFANLTTFSASECGLVYDLPPLPPNVEVVDLMFNDLNGTFQLLAYPKLRRLWLKHNTQLRIGSLPESIDALSNLEVLDLTRTEMSGTLPANLFKLTALAELSLQSCHISGTLPPEVGKLEQLQVLDLSSTSLQGELPAALSTLVHLRVLNLGNVAFSKGSAQLHMFTNLWELTTCLMPQASWLSGTIPASLGAWSKLTSLTITDSSLEGSLPMVIKGMQSLTSLVLAGNDLRGSVPSAIGSLRSLAELVLRNNGLSGTLPRELGYLAHSHLEVLDLRANGFNDTFSGDFMALPPGVTLRHPEGYSATYRKLTRLLLADNPELKGWLALGAYGVLEEIFAENCSFDNLTGVSHTVLRLDFSFNNLVVPPSFSAAVTDFARFQYPAVKYLSLRGNRISSWPIASTYVLDAFTGDAPPRAGYEFAFVTEGQTLPCFHELEELDVSDNPLGVDVQSFISSVASGFQGLVASSSFCAHDLNRFIARNTSLNGTLYTMRKFDFLPTGDVINEQMFPLMSHMDLSANSITQVHVKPAHHDRLVSVNFSLNELHYLERQWLGEEVDPATGLLASSVRTLDISGNPNLNFSVLPPEGDCDAYAVVGAPLAGDPDSYSHYSEGVECSVPCAAYGMVLYADDVLPDLGSLCRCVGGYGLPAGSGCFDMHWRVGSNGDTSCNDIIEQKRCNQTPGAEQCCGCGGAGAGGNGVSCHQCPPDTYSFSEEADTFRLRSECRDCPAHSSTDNKAGQSTLCGCKCEKGMYLDDGGRCAAGTSPSHATASCESCPYLWTTAEAGAVSATECECDTSIQDFLVGEGECGCDQNQVLNHVERACKPCADEGEDCAWVPPRKNLSDSTRPPYLVPGFWAPTGHLAGVSDEAVLRSFSRHSIYKCVSADTCIDEKGTCAPGREGVACSLCKPGYTGGPDGSCRKCEDGEGSAVAGLMLMLVASPIAVLLAHALLSGTSSTRGVLSALRSFRVSARQLIKHVQVVGVVSGFTIKWPLDVERVFERITIFKFNFIDAAGLGCLGRQQTASLELGLRYVFPCAFVLLGIFFTPLMAAPLSKLLRSTSSERLNRMGEGLRMSLNAAMRAAYWLVVLFFPTFLENGLRLFTCNVHPNEEVSVAAFPHLHCLGSKSGADDEWLKLLPAGIAYTALCLGFCLGGYVWVYRRTWQKMEASDFESRGKYEFLFEDFRDSALHWPVLLLCRDTYVNAVGTILNNYGASQLLLVAAGMLLLGYLCIKENPYMDASNTLVEVINALFVFAMCMFTAGMGFSQAPGLEDMATLARKRSSDKGDDVMTTRARILLALQLASLIAPFVVIAYQLLILVPFVERNLPACIRPLQEEDEAALRAYLREALEIAEGDKVNARNVDKMLSRLDGHELQQLVNMLIAAPAASSGVLREPGTSTSLQKLLREATSSQPALASRTLANGGAGIVPGVAHQANDVEHGEDQEELIQLLRQEKEEQAQELRKKEQQLQQKEQQLQQKAEENQKLMQLLQSFSSSKGHQGEISIQEDSDIVLVGGRGQSTSTSSDDAEQGECHVLVL